MSLPDGITKQNILAAIHDLDTGVSHAFAASTGYDVLFNGKRYPPKAVVGLAAQRLTGRQFSPSDFSGGLSSKCFRILEQHGMTVVTKGNELPFPDEVTVEGFTEGATVSVTVNKFERDPAARAAAIKHHGTTCSVCGFDFKRVYGAIGEGFIHVHHVKPLSEIGQAYKVNPKTDLVPVCPNCHAMLHKRIPPYSVTELNDLMTASK